MSHDKPQAPREFWVKKDYSPIEIYYEDEKLALYEGDWVRVIERSAFEALQKDKATSEMSLRACFDEMTAEYQARIKKLDEECSRISDVASQQIASYQKKSLATQKEITQLQAKHEALANQEQQTVIVLEDALAQIALLSSERDHIQSEAEILEKSKMELLRQRDELKEQAIEMDAKYWAEFNRHEQTKAELEHWKSSRNTAIAQLHEKIETLDKRAQLDIGYRNTQISELRAQAEALAKENSELKKALSLCSPTPQPKGD